MDDLISRQAVIEINRSYHGQMPNEVNHRIWKEINDLPSAQPEIIYCGECKHMMPNGKCRQFADSTIRPSASDFCSAGERKDNG